MLKNLELLSEFQYVTGTYPELDLFLSKSFMGGIKHWMMFDYTYTVFIDSQFYKEVIYVSQSTTGFYKPDVLFIEHISRLPEINLSDLTYLCTIYRRAKTENELFKFYSGTIKFLEIFLKETYGKLVYKEHAIDLVCYYSNLNMAEATNLIRDLMDREPNAFSTAMGITVQNNYNFFDLWKEYTFYNRVYNKKTQVAEKLYEILIK